MIFLRRHRRRRRLFPQMYPQQQRYCRQRLFVGDLREEGRVLLFIFRGLQSRQEK